MFTITIYIGNDGWWFMHHDYPLRLYGPYDTAPELQVDIDMLLRGLPVDYWNISGSVQVFLFGNEKECAEC